MKEIYMGEKKKNNMTVLLGAAFLMATSAIGPGFLTQTATFTGQYGSIFAMVIICTILLDVTTQLNIWSIIGVSGMRGQDIANKVLPGLGYFIAFLVALGGLVFNIGNVGGAATGLNVMFGLPVKAGPIIGGALGILGAGIGDAGSAALVGGVAAVAGFVILLGGAINLAIGIFGLRGANDPRKIGAFYALAIIGLAFAVLSALGTFFGGSADGGDIASALFGLVLPLVCVLLAYNIKKENNL